MEEEEQRKVLVDVFGESSSSSSDDDDGCDQTQTSSSSLTLAETTAVSPNWQQIESIPGLWLCSHFLSPLYQSSLLSSIHCEGWFTEESHNQAMRFGDLPSWAVKLSDHIYEAIYFGGEETDILSSDDKYCILPSHLLQRDPFFDQLIVNKYLPGYLCTR